MVYDSEEALVVAIREMTETEKADIDSLFKRSLSPIDLIIFSLSLEDSLKLTSRDAGACLVAETGNKIIGSVSVKIREMRGSLAGFIGALVTDKEYRGHGVAGLLVDEATKWLLQRKCETIYATADRYNSGSWNTFTHRGFSVYELPHQLREHGSGFLRLWLAEFHFIGYGTFFLRRKVDTNDFFVTNESWHFIFAWMGLFTIWIIQILRMGHSLTVLPIVSIVTGISLLAPELLQKQVMRRVGLETVFRAWESGILFSLLLAVLGSYFPAYGSTYVKKLDYRYDYNKSENGIFFTVGTLVSLLLAWSFWVLSTTVIDGTIIVGLRIGYMINLINTLFNLIPMQAAGGLVWDGKKILTWSKTVWLFLLIVSLALVIVDTMI